MTKKPKLGPFVLIRTYSAGVHCGHLALRKGTEVTLHQARRIYSWNGAFTLNEIANAGVGAGSKLSAVTAEIVLTQAIEIITCSEVAAESLWKYPVYKP